MKRKHYWLISLALLSGCASYTQSKIDLTAQAQECVAHVKAAVEANGVREDAASHALRAQLDAAFDEDVANRPAAGLTAEWVLAHRKAYGIALAAFDARQKSTADADRATLNTLDRIAVVLAQLQQMHASELQLTLPEVRR